MIALLLTLALASAETLDQSTPDRSAPDRSTPPVVLPASPRALPEVAWTSLTPAARLGLVQVEGARKVELLLTLERGSLALGGDRTTSIAFGWLQDAATRSASAAEFEIAKDLDDIAIYSNLGAHTMTLSLTVPRESLETALKWLGEVLRTPAFPAADLKRWKQEQTLWYTSEAATSPSSVARSTLRYAWWPADHAYGARPDLQAIAKVSRSGMGDHHGRLLQMAPITLLVAGDLTAEELTGPLTHLIDGLGTPGEPEPPIAVPAPTTRTVLAVDLPSQTQVTVLLRLPAPSQHHPENPSFTAVDHALGGTFVSRLNRNLREEHGYTYGAGSSYAYDTADGSWTLSVDVRGEVLEDTVRQIQHEMDTMLAEGCTTTELDALYRERVAGWNDTMKNAESAIGFYSGLYNARLTVQQAQERLEALATVDTAQTRAAAATWLGPEAGRVWVFVGARGVVEPALGALGMEATWIEAGEAVVGGW